MGKEAAPAAPAKAKDAPTDKKADPKGEKDKDKQKDDKKDGAKDSTKKRGMVFNWVYFQREACRSQKRVIYNHIIVFWVFKRKELAHNLF
jgi:hypothetical protein